MEMFWTRASDMAGAPSVIGGFSEVVRKTRLVATFGSSPTQVLQLAHGPIRDVVQAGAVAEEARQDVEVDLVRPRSGSGVPDSNPETPPYHPRSRLPPVATDCAGSINAPLGTASFDPR